VDGRSDEKLLVLVERFGAGRALNTAAPNFVISDAGIVLLGNIDPPYGFIGFHVVVK
jgi:hypothetical protein